MITNNEVPFKNLISYSFPLYQINDAFNIAISRDGMKVILTRVDLY